LSGIITEDRRQIFVGIFEIHDDGVNGRKSSDKVDKADTGRRRIRGGDSPRKQSKWSVDVVEV
jgi:hypothetical protein